MSERHVKVFPSIMAANYADMGNDIVKAVDAEADGLHLDVMDGHFVPNLTFGPDLVQSLRPLTDIHFDAHLMVNHPEHYIDAFHTAGVNHISIHIEIESDVDACLQSIKDKGMTVGLAINPDTPPDAIDDNHLKNIDRVVVMTVHPGFGGQSFIDQSDKVDQLKKRREQLGLDFDIQLDGGINEQTVSSALQSGADILVAGSAIFKADDDQYSQIIKTLRGQ